MFGPVSVSRRGCFIFLNIKFQCWYLVIILFSGLSLSWPSVVNHIYCPMQLHSIFLHVRKIRRMAGVRNATSMIVKAEWLLNWFMFLFARSIAHILITVKLIRDAHKFEKGVELPLALSGMAGMNLLNIFLGADLFGAYRRERKPQAHHHDEWYSESTDFIYSLCIIMLMKMCSCCVRRYRVCWSCIKCTFHMGFWPGWSEKTTAQGFYHISIWNHALCKFWNL